MKYFMALIFLMSNFFSGDSWSWDSRDCWEKMPLSRWLQPIASFTSENQPERPSVRCWEDTFLAFWHTQPGGFLGGGCVFFLINILLVFCVCCLLLLI